VRGRSEDVFVKAQGYADDLMAASKGMGGWCGADGASNGFDPWSREHQGPGKEMRVNALPRSGEQRWERKVPRRGNSRFGKRREGGEASVRGGQKGGTFGTRTRLLYCEQGTGEREYNPHGDQGPHRARMHGWPTGSLQRHEDGDLANRDDWGLYWIKDEPKMEGYVRGRNYQGAWLGGDHDATSETAGNNGTSDGNGLPWRTEDDAVHQGGSSLQR